MNANFRTLTLSVAMMAGLAGSAHAAGALLTTPNKGEYVYETHMPSGSAAVDKAMAFCRGRYGGGCSVLRTWGSGCVAIAHANGSNHSGWAVSGNPSAAVSLAMGNCEKYGGSCAIQVNKCE